jgi:hypothetical protein
VIWYAGQPTGFLYQNGVIQQPEHGVKVVLTTATGKIHLYPVVISTPVPVTACADCGQPTFS